MSVRHGILFYEAASAPEKSNKNLGLWGRKLVRIIDHQIESTITQFRKIMRFPVIPHPRSEKAVEGLLPGR